MNDGTLEHRPEILLVEDSSIDTMIMLKALNHNPRPKHISVLVDGELAMERLRRQDAAPPDLILLDLNLPKKDGWEVLAECKSDPSLRAIPIVVFTTSDWEKDVKRCYELGANCVLAKPFETEPFMLAVESVENYWLRSAPMSLKTEPLDRTAA